MKTTLTDAQVAQLRYIASGFDKASKPARRASEATWAALFAADFIRRDGNAWTVRYDVTDAGRAYLASLDA